MLYRIRVFPNFRAYIYRIVRATFKFSNHPPLITTATEFFVSPIISLPYNASLVRGHEKCRNRVVKGKSPLTRDKKRWTVF